MFRIGEADGSALLTTGGWMSVGSRAWMRPIARCASIAAWLASAPSTSWRLTCDRFSDEVEVTLDTPEMPDRPPSTIFVTSCSASDGDAPGQVIVIETKGKLMFGSRSTFIRETETTPMMTRAQMNMRMASGRLMASRVRPISALLLYEEGP